MWTSRYLNLLLHVTSAFDDPADALRDWALPNSSFEVEPSMMMSAEGGDGQA